MLGKKGSTGFYLTDLTELKFLLYADNVVLFGNTDCDLQCKINVLEIFPDTWGVELDLKRKIIVFRYYGKLVSRNIISPLARPDRKSNLQ